MRTLVTMGLVAVLAASVPAQNASDIEDFQFEVTTLENVELSDQDLQDQVVLVDFWGTWCGPCRRMIPTLRKLYDQYHEKGLEIVGLAYNEKGSPAEQLQTLRAFATKNEIPYPIALGTPAIQKQVPNFRGYPTLLCFRKGMQCAEVMVGEHSYEDLERFVVAALKEKAPAAKKEDAPVRATLQLPGGRKLEIGGGRHVLILLEHPRLAWPAEDREALVALGKKYGERLEFLQATRDDLEGAAAKLSGAIRLPRAELEKIGFGRAFPLLALFNAEGRRVFVRTGVGGKALEGLRERLTEDFGKKAKQKPEEKGEEKPGAKAEPETESPVKKATPEQEKPAPEQPEKPEDPGQKRKKL